MANEVVGPHPQREDDQPGRRIIPHSTMLQHAEPGWAQRNWTRTEFVQRPEGVLTQRECDAQRDWLRHVEAGRIGEGVRADDGGGDVEQPIAPPIRTFSLNSPEAYAALCGRRRTIW